jgi:glycosyltransferase involved in cell wall biosynthesis
MSKLALVTILYHADNVLEDFFASVSKQTYKNYTLYLIDNSANAKTDEVIAKCLKKFPIPSFNYIDSGGNIGVAAGNNWGIRLAKKDGCEHLLILNNDIVILEADAFEKIMKLSLYENLITTKIFFTITIKYGWQEDIWITPEHLGFIMELEKKIMQSIISLNISPMPLHAFYM